MAARKPGRGVNAKGRSKRRGKFVALGNGMLTSEAWLSLSGPAVKYYIELRRRYNGSNNGELHLSLEAGKRLLHLGKATVLRAQQELEHKGLIRCTQAGGRVQRLASTWALTDESVGASPATHKYRSWDPPKKNPSVLRRTSPGPETDQIPPKPPPSGPSQDQIPAFSTA